MQGTVNPIDTAVPATEKQVTFVLSSQLDDINAYLQAIYETELHPNDENMLMAVEGLRSALDPATAALPRFSLESVAHSCERLCGQERFPLIAGFLEGE